MPDDGEPSIGGCPSRLDSQSSLLRTRIRHIYPSRPTNKHIRFHCTAFDERTYYCKDDADGRPIRATEWISQSLALHLGIAVAEFQIIEHEGETFFGSREAISTADIFKVRDYLSREQQNELGETDWFGRWLSRLYALDMFLNNPDRGMNNFVLENGSSLRAIDFADSRLEDITSERFPVATSNTVCNVKFIENVHGFSLDSAREMIERIRVIPVSVIDGIIGGMPNDWMVDDQKQQIHEAWASGRISHRLSALRAGLEDGSRR